MAITLHQILEQVNYDPETGVFRHVKPKPGGVKAGDLADRSTSPRGYKQIIIKRKRYSAHRLAWWITHGEPPSSQIDHIDGNPSNNRLENLREASSSQNTFAVRRTRRGADRGIRPVGNRWRAQIGQDRKLLHIGYFATRDEAKSAYVAAAVARYGQFSAPVVNGGA